MNFVDVLRRYNIPHQTEGKFCRPGWVQFHCPFCFGRKDAEKPYGGYNIAKNYVNCWACGFHGVAHTLSTLAGIPWQEAKNLVGDLERPRQNDETHNGKLILPDGVGPLLRCHRAYLRGRGFDCKELVRRWEIGGIAFAKRLAWRVFVPIMLRGTVVSWATRSLQDEGLRWITASLEEESVPHKSLLYGEDFAGSAISVHEGFADVWKVGPGAVATMGTSFTPAQLLRMSRYARVLVCFDSEPAAQKRARALCDQLEAFPIDVRNVELDAKDAGEASEEELDELRGLLN